MNGTGFLVFSLEPDEKQQEKHRNMVERIR